MEFQVQLKKTKKKTKNNKADHDYDCFINALVSSLRRVAILEAFSFINSCLRCEDEKKDD